MLAATTQPLFFSTTAAVLAQQAGAAAVEGELGDRPDRYVQPVDLTVTTLNTHLFGRLGLTGPEQQETRFYYKDEERLEGITGYLRTTRPDIVGLQEVWDPTYAHHLRAYLSDLYPYAMQTPWENGVSVVIQAVGSTFGIDPERVAEKTNAVIRELARNHYQISHSWILKLFDKVVPEDAGLWLVQRLLGIRDVWGAGLLFLSRYPIDRERSGFHPHERRAENDRFTGKGILRTVVSIPGNGRVMFLMTHLQEGASRAAVRARTNQLRQMRRLIDKSDFPVIALGDFNIERDQRTLPAQRERRKSPRLTPEFMEMRDILALEDAYCSLGLSHRTRHPGHTYHHGPIARKLGIPESTRERELVIDFILHDSNFGVLAASVDDIDFFLDPEKRDPLSDHRPVRAILTRLLE